MFGLRQGVAEGISLPTMHQLTARWVPPHERSRFVAFVTSGQYVGTVGAMLCSPMVASSWPSIFYLFAGIGFAWCLAWYLLAASTPEQVRKRHFLRHFYIKCIILPRQARDKHRENSKKVPFSRSVEMSFADEKTIIEYQDLGEDI